MQKPNEKNTNEKNIHKVLHKILDAMKILYEICKIFKAILNLFF